MTSEKCAHCCGCKDCHKPNDAQIAKDIMFQIMARDVHRAIHEIGEPIAEWAFLEYYLTQKGVFI